MADDLKHNDDEVMSFNCKVLTPQKLVFDGEIADLTAIGVSGEFELQPRHEPFLSPLKVGIMNLTAFQSGDKKQVDLAVHGGFLDMNGDGVTVYASSAECASDIDLERAKAAKKRAEEMLEEVSLNKGDECPIDIDRAQLSLMRAITRVQLVEKVI